VPKGENGKMFRNLTNVFIILIWDVVMPNITSSVANSTATATCLHIDITP